MGIRPTREGREAAEFLSCLVDRGIIVFAIAMGFRFIVSGLIALNQAITPPPTPAWQPDPTSTIIPNPIQLRVRPDPNCSLEAQHPVTTDHPDWTAYNQMERDFNQFEERLAERNGIRPPQSNRESRGSRTSR